MEEEMISNLRTRIARDPEGVVLVVGAGVTLSALQGSPVAESASWTGLLRSGAVFARERGMLSEDSVADVAAKLAGDDESAWIAAAEQITRALGGRGGGAYRQWLMETVGSFTAHVRDDSVLAAIRGLSDAGVLVMTVNYDGLLTNATGLPVVSWDELTKVERILRGDDRGVLHLHGYWDAPSSVILGGTSYAEIAAHPHAQAVLGTLRMTKTLVFIGHGAGLRDPNWGPFLRWTAEVFAGSTYEHYRLARESERATVQAQHPPAQRIAVLSYGVKHSDLGPFVRSLVRLKVRAASGRTVLVRVNIGAKQDTFLREDEACAQLRDEEVVGGLVVEEVVPPERMTRRWWRGIAARLDRMVEAAFAVHGATGYVVAGQAPLPVFVYLGWRMRAARAPVRVLNLRRDGTGKWDLIGATGEPGGRDPFQPREIALGRGGRAVLAVRCSGEYPFTVDMVDSVTTGVGEPACGLYEVTNPEDHRIQPLTAAQLPVLQRRVSEGTQWISKQCPEFRGLVLVFGGPSWVAFWVGVWLGAPNVWGRVEVPNFVRDRKRYEPALGWSRDQASSTSRVLVVAADPNDAPKIGGLQLVEEVKAELLTQRGRLDAEQFKSAGSLAFVAVLGEMRTQQPDVVHVHVHGSATALGFSDGRGGTDEVPVDRVVEGMKSSGAEPALIVVTACESAELGPRLVEVADCVITVSSVPFTQAIAFSRALHGALARGETIAEAVKQATFAVPEVAAAVRLSAAPGCDPAAMRIYSRRDP